MNDPRSKLSSFFRHLMNVRPIILCIISPMPMSLTRGFLLKGINLIAFYDPLILDLILR